MTGLAVRTHYQVLGISRSANEREIKDAYRQLVKRWHPDVCKEPDAEMRFKELQKAVAVLCDRVKRRDYDSDLTSIEASGLPRDAVDMVMDRFNVTSSPEPRKKKQKKGRKKKAHVFIDEIPDGFEQDETMGGIIPDN